jgi:succinate-acetate transporter protein
LPTFLLSLFSAGLLEEAGLPIVFGVALFYGGLAQFVAGIWEYRNNNTSGRPRFGSFGAFWLSLWAFEHLYIDTIPEAQQDTVVGWFLLAWGIFTTYMWIASFRITAAVNILFLFLAATFFILAAGDLTGSDPIVQVGGYVGLVTAVTAWYASFATVINPTFVRTVLPVKPLD